MGEDSAQQTYSDHSEIQDTNIFQFIQNNQNINFSKNKVDSNVQRRNTANVFLDTFGDLGDDHNVVNKVSYSHNRHKSLVLPKVTQLSHTNISNYDENDDRYDDDLNDALSVTNFSVEDHTLVNFNVDPNNIFAKYSFIIDQNYVNEYYSLQNECDEIAVKIKNLDVGLQQAKVENEDYISPKYKDNIINILEKYEMSINNQKLLYTKIFESSMNANCNVEELLNQLDEDDQKSFDNSGDESFVSLNSNTNNSEKTKIYKLRKFVENKVQFIEEELIVPITHIKNSITNKHQDNLTLIKNTLGTHSQYILQQINEYDETISMISKQYFDKKDSITAMKKKLLDKILKIDNQKAIVYQKIVDDINDKLQIRADNLLKAKKHNELSDLLDTSRRLIAETNDTFKKDHKHLVSYTTQLKDMIDTRFSELKQNYDIKLKESKLQYEGELESQKNELNIIKSQLNEQNKLEIQKLHQELKIAHNKVSCLNEQVQDLTNQKVYLEVQYENLENRYNCEKELHNEILKSENRSDLPDVFDNEQLTLNDTKTLNNSINDSIEEVQLTLNKNTSKINVYSQNTLTPLYQTTIKHSIFAKPEYNTKSFNIFQNSANTIDEADTDLEGENLELKLKVQDLRNDIQELENQKSLLLCKIEDTNHIINKDQENISILNIQLDNANQTLIKKTEDLQNLEQEHEINIKELEKEIKHLQYSIDSQSKTSQQAITSLNRIIDDKSSKISNFRNEIKSYVAQIQDYDQTIALQKQNIDDKTELLREYEEANQKNQIELKRIQDELDIKTMLNIQYIQTQQEQEKTLNQLNQKLFLSEQQAFKLMSDLNHEKRNYLNLEKDKNSLYQVNNLFTTVKGIYTKNVLTSFNVLKYNHNNITNVKFENNVKYDSASNYTFTYINENANLKKDDNKNIIDVFEYTYDKDSIKNEDIKISINVIPPQDFSFDHSEIEEDKVYFDPMLHEFSGREEDDKIYFDQMFHEFSARDQDSFQSTPQNNIVETPISVTENDIDNNEILIEEEVNQTFSFNPINRQENFVQSTPQNNIIETPINVTENDIDNNEILVEEEVSQTFSFNPIHRQENFVQSTPQNNIIEAPINVIENDIDNNEILIEEEVSQTFSFNPINRQENFVQSTPQNNIIETPINVTENDIDNNEILIEEEVSQTFSFNPINRQENFVQSTPQDNIIETPINVTENDTDNNEILVEEEVSQTFSFNPIHRQENFVQSTPQNNIVETPINRDTVKIDIEDDKSINSGRSVDVNMQHDTLRLVVPTDTDLDLNIEEEKNIKELLSLGNIYVSAANIIGDDIQHLDKDNIDLYMLNLQNIKAAKSDPNANDLAPNLDEHVEQTIQDQIMQMIINDGVSIKNEDSVVSHDDEDIKSDETDVATSKQLEKSGEYDKHKLHNPYLGNPFSRRDFGEII